MNMLPSRGRRVHLHADVDDEGVEVAALNEQRLVVVLFNFGPDTAWGNTTVETATPEDGFPLKSGGVVVDDGTIDAWCFKTEEGDTADLRGWEVSQP